MKETKKGKRRRRKRRQNIYVARKPAVYQHQKSGTGELVSNKQASQASSQPTKPIQIAPIERRRRSRSFRFFPSLPHTSCTFNCQLKGSWKHISSSSSATYVSRLSFSPPILPFFSLSPFFNFHACVLLLLMQASRGQLRHRKMRD